MVDFTQFFNPSAWGSWAPPGMQGFLSPQAQNSPNAPVPSGAITPPVTPPQVPGAAAGAPTPAAAGPANPLAAIKQMFNPTPANQSIPGYPGQSGDIGYGVGVGTSGPIPAAPVADSIKAANPDPAATARNQSLNNLLQKSAMGLLQPQQMQVPQIQMARPVGPGQMPPPQMPQQGAPGMQGGWNPSMSPGMLNQPNRFGF